MLSCVVELTEFSFSFVGGELGRVRFLPLSLSMVWEMILINDPFAAGNIRAPIDTVLMIQNALHGSFNVRSVSLPVELLLWAL